MGCTGARPTLSPSISILFYSVLFSCFSFLVSLSLPLFCRWMFSLWTQNDIYMLEGGGLFGAYRCAAYSLLVYFQFILFCFRLLFIFPCVFLSSFCFLCMDFPWTPKNTMDILEGGGLLRNTGARLLSPHPFLFLSFLFLFLVFFPFLVFFFSSFYFVCVCFLFGHQNVIKILEDGGQLGVYRYTVCSRLSIFSFLFYRSSCFSFLVPLSLLSLFFCCCCCL